MSQTPHEILIVGLRNAYALEGQALTTMSSVHDRLEHYPQLKSALAQHIGETERQQAAVERCLNGLGEEPSTLKEMAARLTASMQGMAHMMAGDEVLKNLCALFAFEHFEQAAYRSLVAIAEDCGEASVAQVCLEILREEEAAGRTLGGMIEAVTRTYVRLESIDATAKV